MTRKLRTIAIVVAVFIVVILVLPFLIPVNQFRSTVEEKLSASFGRKVQVGGLSLSLLSGALSAENLSIADDPKFSASPFLTAKSFKVGIEMVPLIFSRSLRVTALAIEKPEVTLLRDAAGRWNYSSLGGSSAKSPSSGKSSGAASDFQVHRIALKDGRISIGKAGSSKRTTYDNVNLSAEEVSLTKPFRVNLSVGLPGGGSLKTSKALVGPLNQQDASLTPFDAKIILDGFDLASSGVLDSSAGLAGVMDLDATLTSENGEAATKGSMKFSKFLLVAGGTPSNVPVTVNFSTNSNLHANTGVLQPSTVKVGNATAQISGTYESRGADTVVNLKFNGQDMPARDLQAFLAALAINLPKGASLETGTLNADLHVTGPTNHLITNGTMGLFKTRLAGFNLGSKLAAISALAGIQTGSDLDIEKLTTSIHMAPDGLRAEQLNLVVPSLGTVIGAGTVDARNHLDFKMLATLAAGASTPGSAGASGVGGLLGGILGGGKSSQVQRIPFLIQGTASDPKFIPDVAGIARDMLKGQISDLTAAPQSNSQQQQQKNNPLSGLGDLFKKKKP
jgi:AsmA protein